MVGAGSTAALAIISSGPMSAVPLRFITGVALAGVYPVGMKLMTTWFKTGRSTALGVLVGALTLGSGLPQLIAGLVNLEWRPTLYASSSLAVVGAIVAVSLVRPGPLATSTPPLAPKYVISMFKDRQQRLINIGYFGHMWELYAFWTWLPAYLAASLASWQVGSDHPSFVALTSFVIIGIAGSFGCVVGGAIAERTGPNQVAAAAMSVSATCCVLSSVVFSLHPAIVLPMLIWGAAVIADSPQFSTALSQAADERYVGTALTAQTAIGFALTTITIQGLPLIADIVGWQYAFIVLGVGPVVGVAALASLMRSPSTKQPVEGDAGGGSVSGA